MVIRWETNEYNTYIAQYLKQDNQIKKFGQLIEYNRSIILENSTQNRVEKLALDYPFLKNQN